MVQTSVWVRALWLRPRVFGTDLLTFCCCRMFSQDHADRKGLGRRPGRYVQTATFATQLPPPLIQMMPRLVQRLTSILG